VEPVIPGAPYQLSGVGVEASVRLNTSVISVQASRKAGEDSAAGWYNAVQADWSISNELGTKYFYVPASDWFRPDSYAVSTEGADIETERDWRFAAASSLVATASYAATLFVTHHEITFTMSGTVTVDGAAQASKTVEIYEYGDAFTSPRRSIGTATTNGSGAYSFAVLEDTRNYFVRFEDGVNVGACYAEKPTTDMDVAISTGSSEKHRGSQLNRGFN
jgi:hypothetical protein